MGAIYYKICIDSYEIYLLECFTSPLTKSRNCALRFYARATTYCISLHNNREIYVQSASTSPRSRKKDSFYRQILLSFRRDFAHVTRQFFAPSVHILYAADFNYLIRAKVTYILLDISVVNSHATSVHECELLAVTWHYVPSVRLDNAAINYANI